MYRLTDDIPCTVFSDQGLNTFRYNLNMFYLLGDCDMAVCGGVNCIIEPRVFVALSKAKMISPEGTSKPFSKRADGYGRGEGCGVVLLKPLKKV